MGENQQEPQSNGQNESPTEISFNYVKSRFFRVVHADGAWGGVSPKGDIHVSFYNERAAIPDSSKLVLSPTGKLLKPEEFMATSELVREMEVDVVVDLGTAIQLRTWLDDKIRGLQLMISQSKKEKADDAQKIHSEG